ncbi:MULTISPECIES: major outer membrane protein [Campylobacter]|uniref:major outer membrane protein n=1 Tax=Campylobacter TaxID=194 RepID=UPI0023F0DBFE|nr:MULTISPECIES: major outer membrane protein [Campylobacter]MCI6642485.1 major outer membrane protein [Campylobacter sp.]MDD7422980.1 major outer membrane protein [Campylobacter hominis]MDY3116847.1 major outer membrane protein [Campylobacter hominis]
MKLLKLSLVAALAAGALATTASAVPLEEAIKDVDVSGFLRLRYTADDEENDSNAKWNIKSVIDFKAKIDDNFFAVAGVRYGNDQGATEYGYNSGNGNFGGGVYSNTADDQFDMYRAYIGYTVGNTTVQLGRQNVFSFFTDDMYGDGLFALNSDIQGLTLGALWMDALEQDDDISSNIDAIQALTGKRVTDHDLYGVGAIGSYDPVSFQLWYAYLNDVVGLLAVDLGANFDVNDDLSVGLQGQYGHSFFDNDLTDTDLIDDGDFYAIEASANIYFFDLAAGYVNYSTDEGKISLNSFEDVGSFIRAGEELVAGGIFGTSYQGYIGENDYWFVKAGVTIPDTGFRIGADYLDGEFMDDVDASEVVARIDYKYNEKLNFQTWYSYIDWEDGADDNRFRFEAKYSF